MKLRFTPVLLLAVLLAPSGLSSAEKIKDEDTATRQMATGKEVRIRHDRYRLIPWARVTHAEDTTSGQPVRWRSRLGRYGVLLFESEPRPSAEHLPYKVALNTRTEQVVIIMNQVMIRPAPDGDLAGIAIDYGLTLERRFDHLGVAYYAIDPGEDAVGLIEDIRADSRVLDAELQVVEQVRNPR